MKSTLAKVLSFQLLFVCIKLALSLKELKRFFYRALELSTASKRVKIRVIKIILSVSRLGYATRQEVVLIRLHNSWFVKVKDASCRLLCVLGLVSSLLSRLA
jgi:hypothetical protein